MRANLTSIKRCLDVSSTCGTYLETHAQYDQTGNVVSAWNERGIATTTEYAINSGGSGNLYHHAYPTKVTMAAPDPSGIHGSTTSFESSSIYDWRSGLVTSTTDANNQTTTVSYADDSSNLDPLLRPRKVIRPDGSWTKTIYHDAIGTPGTTSGLYVYSETQMDSGRTTFGYQFFDALGRTKRSQSFAGGSSYLTVDTQYDDYGRAYRTSNPYTTTLGGSVNPSGKWTTITGYDALSRVTEVTLPDDTTIGTSYSGIYTTVTDQGSRQRRQKVDGLGRIVRVDEADPDSSGSLGSVGSPNLASYYYYDTLGNLVHIQQGKGSTLQHRYFKYDALGRLTYERQVEATGYFSQSDSTGNSSWSRKLAYDETYNEVTYSGLLTSNCDARNVCAKYKYDQLNRLTEVEYDDGRTPALTNNYDQAHSGYYNKGRLTEVITASVSDDTNTSYDDRVPETRLQYDFDLMGRTVKSSQVVDSNTYTFTYQYNLGGQLTRETYPSGRVVNFGYDEASRLSNLNGGQGHVYADAFTYASHGAISSFTLGNGATLSLGYGTNGRLQLSDLTLSKYSSVLQKYEYKYGQIVSGTLETLMNNGQLAQVESWIGTEKQYRQQYFYDTLGRLKESIEKYGTDLANTAYDVKYRYDEFGNRQQREADNSGNTGITQKWVESGDISTSTNRYASNVTYDAAGNITADPKFRNLIYKYDANGRQKYAANANGSSPVTAIFDGAGQRVANKASGVMTIMVYDAGGKLAAEYGATSPSTASLQYVTADYQGSTRVVTDSAGTVANRRDYLPFGEEIGATVGSRAGKGFGAGDGVRQKYAGMETDDATNMAHTLWRKQDNLSGRWTSPDPYGGSMTIADPQSFNRYSYVNNDPVNQSDLTGLISEASQGWNGSMWGGEIGFNQPHFGGPAIIENGVNGFSDRAEAKSMAGLSKDESSDIASKDLSKDVSESNGSPQENQQVYDPCTSVNAAMDESGQGYYTYEDRQWLRYGQPNVVAVFQTFASAWHEAHEFNPIGVGDLGELGGAGNFARHPGGGHAGGLIIDLRPMRNDNVRGPTNFNDRTYSRDLTTQLIQRLSALPEVVSIRFNDANINDPKLVRDANRFDAQGRRLQRPHDNHLHVVFRSAAPCPVNLNNIPR